MNVKHIKFDLATAMKVQSGELKGVVRTKGGFKVTILATDLDNESHPLAVRHYECSRGCDHDKEYVDNYTIDGEYWDRSDECQPNDLIIELIEDE